MQRNARIAMPKILVLVYSLKLINGLILYNHWLNETL